MAEAALKVFRDRFGLSIPDDQLLDYPTSGPRRQPRGSYLQSAVRPWAAPAGPPAAVESLAVPELSAFGAQWPAPGSARSPTTMAFVRILTRCCATSRSASGSSRSCPTSRAPSHGGDVPPVRHLVQGGPALPAEDANQLMLYKEDRIGQLPPGGHQRPGARSSWLAAAPPTQQRIPRSRSTSTTRVRLPRVGDLAGRPGTAGPGGYGSAAPRQHHLKRGGLQHEDGHSHIQS